MNAQSSTPYPTLESRMASNGLMDIPALWAVFRRRFWLFLLSAVTIFALTIIITFQLTPKYVAEARVVLNDRETQALDMSAILSGVSPDAAVVDTEVEIILSRSMAEKVADELNLYTVPEFNPALVEGKGARSLIFPNQLSDDIPDEERIKQKVVERVMEALEAERAGITYAIVLRATSEDPRLAAEMANTLADKYIVNQLDEKFEAYQRVTTYLQGAVQSNRDDLRAAENAVERYRNDTGLLTAEGSLLSEQQIADLQAQLIVQEADLSERQAKLGSVNRRLALGEGVDAISDVLASQVIGALRAKQADLTRRRADLETRYGPRHPLMDNIRSEEADLNQQVESEIGRIVSGLQNDVDVARQRVRSLSASIDELRAGLGADNQDLVRLRELEQDAKIKRNTYERLLERSQEVQLLEGVAEPDARQTDSAVAPTRAAFPNKFLNALLGMILGGAVGGLMVVLAEAFDNGLRTTEDVERNLDMSMVALVPELSKDKLTGDIKTPADYIVERPLSSFAESYRTLRSAITLQADEKSVSKVVAMTSAVSGEGKTVSSLCLARIAALAGDRVILIDCDVRRRALSAQVLGDDDDRAEQKGLGEVLTGAAPLRSAIRKDEPTGLDILTVSQDRSGLGDLFGTGRFAAMLAKLRTKYNLIILDTAPLTAVADTRMIVDLADVAVQFVKWKTTPVKVAKAARKVLAGVKTPVAGAVLTQVDMRAQSGYSFEGSDKYYAQHGKYYFD